MSTTLIPLVAPCITASDKAQMVGMAASGELFEEATVSRFEEAFAAYVGCGWAVAVNSGTNALAVALELVGAATVTIPSWTCVAVRNAAKLRGFDVGYVDSEFEVRRAFASMNGEAAVVAHMFGRWTETPHGHPAIEDYTLSLGALGSFVADIGVCSFSADKMISTGRGGIVFGDDEDLRARVESLVHYERHTDFGFSVAMSPMQAALGLSQLRQLPRFIERRRELADRYTAAFRPAGIECPDPDCGSVFFRYLIAADDPAAKVAGLAEHGIEAGRGVYPPLHRLAGLPDVDFPGTTAAVNSLLSVPVHPSITDTDAAHIIDSVLDVCNR